MGQDPQQPPNVHMSQLESPQQPPVYPGQQPQQYQQAHIQPVHTAQQQQPVYGYQPPLQHQGTLPQQVPGQQVPVQAGGPVYVQQAAGQFQMATPLAALNQGPAPVDCPACGQRGVTAVTYESGGTTQ